MSDNQAEAPIWPESSQRRNASFIPDWTNTNIKTAYTTSLNELISEQSLRSFTQQNPVNSKRGVEAHRTQKPILLRPKRAA